MRASWALLLQPTLCVLADVAFVAAPPRWQSVEAPSHAASVAAAHHTEHTASFSSVGTMLLVGACVGVLANARRMRKETAVSRSVWTYQPKSYDGPDWPELGQTRCYSPTLRTHIRLKKQAKIMGFKQGRWKSQYRFQEAGVGWATPNYWTKWQPNRDNFNMYKGPESHPDNPFFPATSSGVRAVRGWAAAPLAASTRGTGRTGSFVAGRSPVPLASAKRAVQPARSARSGIVLKAHKKAAASSKNQGHHAPNPKYWGVKKLSGAAVKCGELLVKQKGQNWYPGANVIRAKNHSLVSLKDGIVQWVGTYRHKEVIVVPWEYVNNKCKFVNRNLRPTAYEPWMGTHGLRYRHTIRNLYKKWAETDEGKAHAEKKAKAKEKNIEIMRSIRARNKQRRREKLGLTPRGEQKEKAEVSAGESESEAES